jgi:hypothetical protein
MNAVFFLRRLCCCNADSIVIGQVDAIRPTILDSARMIIRIAIHQAGRFESNFLIAANGGTSFDGDGLPQWTQDVFCDKLFH